LDWPQFSFWCFEFPGGICLPAGADF